MTSEEARLREAKVALESALAEGKPVKQPTSLLEEANEKYKLASQQIRKHTVLPKAKSTAKAKAKAKA